MNGAHLQAEGNYWSISGSAQYVNNSGCTPHTYPRRATPTPGCATREGDILAASSGVALQPASPNPFNPRTRIEFHLPFSCHATLTVYNLAGRKIKTLVSRDMQAGTHSVVWDGTDGGGARSASGVYFCRLRAGSHAVGQKLVMLK